MKPLNKEQQAMYNMIKEYDGAEIPKEGWKLAEEIAKTGRITLSSARGPNKEWKRAELVKVAID